jgi:ubiquinone/menaquinone biosynthesis C-methylase UbiE
MTSKAAIASPLYAMESEQEWKRQHNKNDEQDARQQLIDAGIDRLPGDVVRAVDAGSGSGFVSKVMAGMLGQRYAHSTLHLLDISAQRLEMAAQFAKAPHNVEVALTQCNLEQIPYDSNTADFVFSRFVFEFLQNPQSVFDELVRITKPGGRLTIGDLDYNSMTHYPVEVEMDRQIHEIVEALAKARLVDPYIGRKLYSYFYQKGFKQIDVRVSAHHLFYGGLKSKDEENWTAKLEQIKALKAKGELSLSFDVADFEKRFMKFFASPERFSYTPLVFVTGVKA